MLSVSFERTNAFEALFAVGVLAMPLPSRQGLSCEPTPSWRAFAASSSRIPAKLLPAKSVKPVPYVASGVTVPEYPPEELVFAKR